MIFFPRLVISHSHRRKSSIRWEFNLIEFNWNSIHLGIRPRINDSYKRAIPTTEFPFLRFFSPREFKHIPLALIAIVCKCFSKKPTTVLEKPFSSIRLDYKFHYYRCNSPRGWEKPTIYVVRALQTWSSRWSSIEFTRSGSREYRYVLTPRLLSFPRSFFAYTIDGKRKKCGRRGRKDASLLDTVERGCSGGCGGGGGVGAFRECRRLRLMLFTQSPGYLAFLQHDWLLPRAPVRSLVLSSGIVGAPSSPRQRFLYNAPPIVRYLRVRENSRRHSSARWFATTVCQRRGPSFVARH